MPIQFTDEQRAVVAHQLARHARVLAGPGTGKSATAAGLAEQLLNQEPAPRLKFLTFTRAATLELDKKLAEHGKLRPQTIHSFSIATLLRNPGSAPFPAPLRIADNYEYAELIRPHLASLAGILIARFDDLVREMAARWESLDPAELRRVTPDERARFIGAYTTHRRIFGYTLLQELPDLLRCALRDHDDLDGIEYDLFVVDEYQDLNACELEILRRLAARGISIVAIGDDDQSIYSFRKAHPAGIRRFLQEFPGAADYMLSICQRLPARIAAWAQHVIAGEVGRQKPPIVCRAGAADGTVGLLNFRGEVSEAQGIANLVCWLRDTQRVPLSEILILCRTDNNGTFTRPVKEEFDRRGIAMFDPSEVDRCLSDPDNRTLLATLRLLVDRRDSLAWRTLLRLEHGIGDTFVAHIYHDASERGISFGDAVIDAGQGGFADLPRVMQQRGVAFYHRVTNSLDHLRLPEANEDTNWGRWILERADAGNLSRPTESLRAMLVKVDETYEEAVEGLSRYLSQLQPLAKDLARAQADGVRFMTMVGSKGLTVRATIVMGADGDLIPRPQQDIDEERRLLYVAMTRSTECLFLTWANRRRGPGARAGHANPGRRTYTELLRGGPVESEDGQEAVRRIVR